MSEETIIRHCSPTLAGIKTGNLFRCSYRTKEEMRSDVRHWNTVLSPKGLRIIPLRFQEDSALIYVYRPARLQKDLENGDACALLRERGYCTENPSRCVACLIERLKESQEFPHEIGLFLRYPPEDVTVIIPACSSSCIALRAVFRQQPQEKAMVPMEGLHTPCLLQQRDRYTSTSLAMGVRGTSNRSAIT